MTNYTIPQKIMVGLRGKTGYMFHVEKTPSKNKKSVESIRKWGGENIAIQEYDNNFIDGFIIGGFCSRYSTSNKVIIIKDPRGFELQVYVDDFINMINDLTIVKGVIQEKCCWVRSKGYPVLVREEGDIQQKLEDASNKLNAKQSVSIDLRKLNKGDVFTDGRYKYVYEGLFDLTADLMFDKAYSKSSDHSCGEIDLKSVHIYHNISYSQPVLTLRKGHKVTGCNLTGDTMCDEEFFSKSSLKVYHLNKNMLNIFNKSDERRKNYMVAINIEKTLAK